MRTKYMRFVLRLWMNWERGWTELCGKHDCGTHPEIAPFGSVMHPRLSLVFGVMRFIVSCLQMMILRELPFAA